MPLDNHIYVVGQVGYQNNSAPAAYNPDQARRDLDALGWKLNGAMREKDGKQLSSETCSSTPRRLGRSPWSPSRTWRRSVSSSCSTSKPGNGFFNQYVSVGDFDIVQFGWVGNAFPLSALPQIYTSDGEGNFGKIGNAAIDAKIDQTMSELDEGGARDAR